MWLMIEGLRGRGGLACAATAMADSALVVSHQTTGGKVRCFVETKLRDNGELYGEVHTEIRGPLS
jgi:hypothetical protein